MEVSISLIAGGAEWRNMRRPLRVPTVLALSGPFGAGLLNDKKPKVPLQLAELVNGQNNYLKPPKK